MIDLIESGRVAGRGDGHVAQAAGPALDCAGAVAPYDDLSDSLSPSAVTSNGSSHMLLDMLSSVVMGMLLVPKVMPLVLPAPSHRMKTRRFRKGRAP